MTNLRFFGGRLIVSPVAVFTVAMITAVDRTGTVLYFILASLLHELGHILAIRLCKGNILRVSFELFRLTLERPIADTSLKKDIIITAAGSAINSVLAIASFFAYKPLKNEMFLTFCMSNVMVGCYNFLPLKFLDGGEMISICEKMLFGERSKGNLSSIFNIITVILGIIASVLLIRGNPLAALLCLYPALLSPIKQKKAVRVCDGL